MRLTATFDIKQFRNDLTKFRKELDRDILTVMQKAGEDFVTSARNMTKTEGGFNDITGNLRSSIGYVILRNGEQIIGEIKGNKSEGISAAKKAVDEVEKTEGIQLIAVAGMEYASYVESRGYNVISVQGELLLIDLKKYMKEIERKYNRR